jgi:hypothetical protein
MQTQASGVFFSPINDASVAFDDFNRVESRSKKLTKPVEFDRDASASIQPDSERRRYEKLYGNMMKLAGQTLIF